MLSLTKINLPKNIKTIGNYAFAACISLEEINIPTGVEFIGSCFPYCLSLKNLIIPGTAEINLSYFGDNYLLSLENLVFEEGAKASFYIAEEEEEEEAEAGVEDLIFWNTLLSLTYLSIPSTFDNNITINIEPTVKLKNIYNYSKTTGFLFVPYSVPAAFEKINKFMAEYTKEMLVAEVLSECDFNLWGTNFEYDKTFTNFITMLESEDIDVDETLNLLNHLLDSDFSSLYEFYYLLDSSGFGAQNAGGCTLYCYEDSAQHELFTNEPEFYVRHFLFDSGNECTHKNILSGDYFSGESGDVTPETTIHWEIDIESRTLLLDVNGTDFGLHHSLAALSYLYDSVVFTPDSNFTKIREYAFAGTSIKKITIPNSVTTIGEYAFAFCDNLQTISFADDFDHLIYSELNLTTPYCDNFTSFEINADNPVYSVVDGLLYDKDCKTLIAVPSGIEEVNNIAETVEHIEAHAFTYSEMRSVTIPDSVTVFPSFFACRNLEIINVGMNAHEPYHLEEGDLIIYAPRLTSINIHPDNKSLCYKDGVLYNYDKTTLLHYLATNKSREYIIADSVKHIDPKAFCFNEYLRNIIVPSNVELVRENSFSLERVDWNALPCTVTFLNPKTSFPENYLSIGYEQIIISGYLGSTAEEYASSLNHQFIPLTDCQHKGGTASCEKRAVCELCGEEYGSLGSHTEDTYTENESCTVNGYTIVFCTVCGEELEYKTIEAKHLWEEEYTVITPASCTAEGLKKRSCERCNEEDSQTIPMAEHDFSSEWTADKIASCTESGSESRHCKNCTAVTDVREIPSPGHSFGEWYTVKEPTFTEKGIKEHKCTVCFAVETNEIPTLEHKEYTDAASGISITADKNAYGGAELTVTVEEIFDGSHYLGQSFGKHEAWNITTYIDGEEVQPSSPVYVKIPVPENFNVKKIFVYHINSQTNEREKVDIEVIDGYICFYASSFSVYIIVDESSLIEDNTEKNCDHLCHKDGFLGFIWKIVQFFSKLFKINPVCECGKAHY